MSCTENESGPLVKYILPAIFGGLTLLLAKRWANIQAPHISTTGVSRRRRIVKDPLVKRPLAITSPKVMTQSSNSKRVESVVRKSPAPYLPPEEDNLLIMPPGNRRLPRNTRMSPAIVSVTPLTNDFAKCNFSNSSGSPAANLGYDIPFAPKHIPFPNIPHDGDLLFEIMMFVFTSLAAGTQFLNLYRTVWWLPHSYTSQTMNFYLIDRHLVLFIVIVLGRRLLFSVCSVAVQAITPVKLLPLMTQILRFLVLGLVLGALGWCTYHLVQTHAILSIFYLCYPASVYLLLFGAKAAPLLQVEGRGSARPPHCCAAGAPAVRNEVELLKADFNGRLKQIIFSSVVGAYYSSYVPWCFAQPFLYYDVYRVIRHLALVWLGLFTQHATHCLSARYCDHLHKASLHLGRWVRGGTIPASQASSSQTTSPNQPLTGGSPPSAGQWCHKTLWAAGSSVRHGRSVYTASGCMTAAEPGNEMHSRFYSLFHNPSTMLCVLLCLQISLVLMQLFLLFNTTEWHHVLSLALLLFSNYYTLFKLVRDYLVTWKVYQAEFTIQDKASIAPT